MTGARVLLSNRLHNAQLPTFDGHGTPWSNRALVPLFHRPYSMHNGPSPPHGLDPPERSELERLAENRCTRPLHVFVKSGRSFVTASLAAAARRARVRASRARVREAPRARARRVYATGAGRCARGQPGRRPGAARAGRRAPATTRRPNA